MTETLTPGGTIWSSGLHHVYVNGNPATVKVPTNTINPTFQQFKDEIKENGGITLGIDHIPEDLLKEYPILSKLNPLDVGRITEVKTDGERIYATRSEHTNPLIAELYTRGELPSYSIVAGFKSHDCPTGDADYVLDKITKIERTDYVDEGGCSACKVGAVPDDMILTAKLAMEEKTMTDEERRNETEEQDESNPSNEEEEEEEESSEEEEQEEQEEESEEVITKADLKDLKADIMGAVTEALSGQDQTVTAKLAKIEEDSKLEAKKVKVEAKINTKIKDGYILPTMKDGLLKASLATEKDEDVDKMLAGFTKKLWDGEQRSQNPTTDTEISVDEAMKRLGKA